MTKHWDYDEARGLKAQGMGWTEIGRIFGVSATMAHMRADPIYAAKRRDQINANRRMASYTFGKRDHVHHVIPEPVKAEDTDTGPFMTPSGIMAYRKHIPNRISLTSQPVYEATATKVVTLPWVSILGGRYLQHREG